MKGKLTPLKFIVFSLIACTVSIAGALVAGEAFLRLWAGIQPWENYPIAGEPVIHEPDPVLGWRNRPGEYVFPLTGDSESVVRMTFGKDGSRMTGPSRPSKQHRLYILGCSLTQGWTISDDETYAWKLQSKLTKVEICNYGTGGYGTYQSLLLLERLLSRPEPPPYLVLYGFAPFHEDRNVAGWYWLKLLSKFSHRGHVEVPYCDLDPATGLLRRHAPAAYPSWPLKRSLASVVVAEEGFARLQTRRQISQRREVTEQLLLEMSRVCREKGVRFLVALLAQEADSNDYREFFERNGLEYADCRHPKYGTPEFMSARDGHPNEQMNQFWAERIEKAASELAQFSDAAGGPQDCHPIGR